jgi:two-component system NtrC family response regulator
MANILIIDDDQGFCYTLTNIIQSSGHAVTCANFLRDGLDKALCGTFDVVFLDVMLPDGYGLDVLPRIRGATSKPEVIIITSDGDPDGAELAIKNGAWDYIQKPSSIKQITLPFLRALQYREEKKVQVQPVALKRKGIIGSGPQISGCLDLLAQAARTEANVIITGETGSGKELFARAIHANSSRSGISFVVVDCAALPETLVESILFGHNKGAFTGADKNKEGLITQANGGTLFLDEVGELPLSIQGAFLRSVQERQYRPLGNKREIKSDFRIVAATNRDLDKMVDQRQFRKDLLFRLKTITIELPPLRERRGDIRELAMYHMAKLSERYGTGTKGFSPEFLEALMTYDWPGNVRELFNALERAHTSAAQDPILFPKHLPNDVRIKITRDLFKNKAPVNKSAAENLPVAASLPPMKEFRAELIAEGEKKYLHDLISRTGGDIKEACRISGLGRARLYGLIKKYNVSKKGSEVRS